MAVSLGIRARCVFILSHARLAQSFASQPIFRFADTDAKFATKALRQHEEELTRVLKDTVPGLVQGSENALQATLAAVGTDDRLMGTGQHHRVLVHPNAFHVSVLFQPTLAFLDRISDVLPAGLETARASSAVLDEFVLKVYLPQLEDKVSALFHQTVTSAFSVILLAACIDRPTQVRMHSSLIQRH